jgi:hypothetical protein
VPLAGFVDVLDKRRRGEECDWSEERTRGEHRRRASVMEENGDVESDGTYFTENSSLFTESFAKNQFCKYSEAIPSVPSSPTYCI